MPPVSSSDTELLLEIAAVEDLVCLAKAAKRFAAGFGFSVRAQWEIAIAASEAASNMIKFAGGGLIQLVYIDQDGGRIELLARDRGPGIKDGDRVLEDGFSEGRRLADDLIRERRRGLGCGLPAIKRLMDFLAIYSPAEGGTLLRASKFRKRNPLDKALEKVVESEKVT
jgi:serine/threonine-protein kinase RsbT